MLSAVVVAPGRKEVFPIADEAIKIQDGETKNDGEINAAKRLIIRIISQYSEKKFIFVEDALYANGPHIRQIIKAGSDCIIGIKPKGNNSLFKQFGGRKARGKVKTKVIKTEEGNREVYSFSNDLRLNGAQDLSVNMLVFERWSKKGRKQTVGWLTTININVRNVVKLTKKARSRWKIEHETFNTLKNQSYRFEHNYGHGKQYLANNFALLMIIAFLTDQIRQACSKMFKKVWAKAGSKINLWEVIRSMFRLLEVRTMQDCLYQLYAKYRY